MTLHERLEAKRRQNIVRLQEAACCHICECTSQRRCFSNFITDDAQQFTGDDETEKAMQITSELEVSESQRVEPTAMRTCQCFGVEEDSGCWPYSLRVCEMCIKDDALTGRIRFCGLCGIVACDEDCGAWEMVECTDREEWENAGCLECRGMEAFSEMDIFRRGPYPRIPRINRVCMRCVQLIDFNCRGEKHHYHFKCRLRKCSNFLIPSDVVENKRYSFPFTELKRFIEPFPLQSLPEVIMRGIFSYLNGEELMNVGFTCSSLLSQAEKVAMEIAKSVNHQYISGPLKLVDAAEKDPTKIRFYLEGTNNFHLRAPLDQQDFHPDLFDAKTWLLLLRQMERMTQEIYYLGFEVALGDYSAPSRYLRSQEKIGFNSKILLSSAGSITSYHPSPHPDNPHRDNITIRGGNVQVTQEIASIPPDTDDDMLIFPVNNMLTEGVHRIICRFACTMTSQTGSVGIIAINDDGIAVWEVESTFHLIFGNEIIVGLEYDSSQHSLQTYSIIDNAISVEKSFINQKRSQLCFAASLSRATAAITYNQLSVRECCPEVWRKFITHTPQLLSNPQLELIPAGDIVHVHFSGNRTMQSVNVSDVSDQFYIDMFVNQEAAVHE